MKTDIKDINDKWIYEGDFITCDEFQMDGMPLRNHKNALVIFKDGVFYYSIDEKRGYINPHQILHYARNVEVIGNNRK